MCPSLRFIIMYAYWWARALSKQTNKTHIANQFSCRLNSMIYVRRTNERKKKKSANDSKSFTYFMLECLSIPYTWFKPHKHINEHWTSHLTMFYCSSSWKLCISWCVSFNNKIKTKPNQTTSIFTFTFTIYIHRPMEHAHAKCAIFNWRLFTLCINTVFIY